MTTQTLTYIGETRPAVVGGSAGFVIDRQYELVTEQDGDSVLVQLPHAPGRSVRVSAQNFKKWFRRA